MFGPYGVLTLAVERNFIALSERAMQVARGQGIALVQAVVVGRIGEDQRQDAVIDQVLPVDTGKALGQDKSQSRVSRCHGSVLARLYLMTRTGLPSMKARMFSTMSAK